jgi:uncharacterized membrane protein
MQRKKLLILVCLLILVVGAVAYFFVKNKNTQKEMAHQKMQRQCKYLQQAKVMFL